MIYRAELVLFLGLIVLLELATGRMGLLSFIINTVLAGVVWLGVFMFQI